MNVSIVIPAYNAAGTIAETLASLLSQTFTGWDAIIVDDGSYDATLAIAATFAERDARFTVKRQPHLGVSAARNHGLNLANHDWLLFLDADDWISPEHLERMTSELVANPELDAAVCGWTRVTPKGEPYGVYFPTIGEDQFALLACYSAFAIHACLVRRAFVESVGGFDTTLLTCEDWDLWQRVARGGGRFGLVQEALALYRGQPDSASINSHQLLKDGLRVILRGHSADPRVVHPHPAYAAGRPVEEIPGAEFQFASWVAGLAISQGEDGCALLDLLNDAYDPTLNPDIVAQFLFEALPLPVCQKKEAWIDLLPHFQVQIDNFLKTLEKRSGSLGLARSATVCLERLIIESSSGRLPATIGSTYAVRINIEEQIPDVCASPSCERLLCIIELAGGKIGVLELPICDGLVPETLLLDAIAAEFAWPVLGWFFEKTILPDLRIEQRPRGTSIWRGDLLLAEELAEDEIASWSKLHDRFGWGIFLQEIWGKPGWNHGQFYDPHTNEENTEALQLEDGWLIVELSEPLPAVETPFAQVDALLTVGGVGLGVVTVPVEQSHLSAQMLRAALTNESGFELCRAVVREALIGKPIDQGGSLRVRLVEAATQRAGKPGWLGIPGSSGAIPPAFLREERLLVLGRRDAAVFGTSACRRAVLPAAAGAFLVDAAYFCEEPILNLPPPGIYPVRVVYAPDLITRPSWRRREYGFKRKSTSEGKPYQTWQYDRNHFESAFANRPDPWKYTGPYEQEKYARTLALLPSIQFRHALELGCAEGHFTLKLAEHVEHLIAADISQIALDRAAGRCAGFPNIHFKQLDLITDPLPIGMELIVCSEVLYYAGSLDRLQAIATKIVGALAPGGYLITTHANLVVDEPDRPGFDWDMPFGAKVIGETFNRIAQLHLVKEIHTPLYRIQLFERRQSEISIDVGRLPEIIELPVAAAMESEVAAHVLWHGGMPLHQGDSTSNATYTLPILMYHRVASEGSAQLSQWRVTPERFEEQLHYLSEAGYYSLRLEDWWRSVEARQPLPRRAVLITFDDGYLDFLTYAWPLLKRYGFTATVFLVAGNIGGINQWDQAYGEALPLLGWKEIRQLQAEGNAFGSHSVSHPRLTALSNVDIVYEAARSRSLLESGLGKPVTAFAYPYGAEDRLVQHLVGACGYTFGLNTQDRLAGFGDPLLSLPRIEITEGHDLGKFVTKLNISR